MCTLSVITRRNGYALAMNRDERVARGECALPPSIFNLGGVRVVMPHETSGGTWIASNERGVTLALLNWHVPSPVTDKERSRGTIIPELIRLRSQREVAQAIAAMRLDDIRPFRLVGVFSAEQEICEWRWSTGELALRWFGWQPHQWFSSGLGDAAALKERSAACRIALHHSDAGSLAWLRRLHRSHRAQRRELAICVHREGVETLSYTEIVFTSAGVRCRYATGTPCASVAPVFVSLPERSPRAVRSA